MKEKIDFVILWVDGSDPEWLKEKNQYSEEKIDIDSSMIHKQTIDENKNSHSEHLIELKGE